MEEERIDINDLYAAIEKNGGLNGMEEFDSVCAELKRMYEKEDANKPCDCEDPDYAYYWYSSSGCFTVIHGSAECSECGKAWKATQEGDWTIHFDRPTEDPSTG